MGHFTYNKDVDKSCLKQGDILNKTDEIKKLLKEVHPHYLKPDYKYLIVLTQSCDLVERDKGKCKARYTTLAAVRPLDLLIEREIFKYKFSSFEKKANICDVKWKKILHEFLERLFNNNEIEYFYLNEDSGLNFPENCVAFLRLSIAIKSSIHIDICKKAKILELEDTFKAKLGWLVGMMYSRVGTKDWYEKIQKEEFDKKIDKILTTNTMWLRNPVIRKIKTEYKDKINSLGKEEILELVDSIKTKSNKEIMIDRIKQIVLESGISIDKEKLEKLGNQINSDSVISTIVK